jgi:hypothetical protein
MAPGRLSTKNLRQRRLVVALALPYLGIDEDSREGPEVLGSGFYNEPSIVDTARAWNGTHEWITPAIPGCRGHRQATPARPHTPQQGCTFPSVGTCA